MNRCEIYDNNNCYLFLIDKIVCSFVNYKNVQVHRNNNNNNVTFSLSIVIV